MPSVQQPPVQQPPVHQPPPVQGYGAPQYAGAGPHGGYGQAVYPRASSATAALVLSIVGFFCCFFISIIGAIMGHRELDGIRAGQINPVSEGTAKAAIIIGWGVTALTLLVVLAYVFLVTRVATEFL